jgi:molybdopterin synthase catalytic subunit
VPIWKRETGADGTFWIEGPKLIEAATDEPG